MSENLQIKMFFRNLADTIEHAIHYAKNHPSLPPLMLTKVLVGTLDVNATISESGGAVVTISIDVPAGINGIQSSQSGLGIYGWG